MLGLAAIASSIARPPERDRSGDGTPGRTTDTSGAAPTVAAPLPGEAPADLETIQFSAGGPHELHKLERGRPATVLVGVRAPGQVEIPSLGLTQPAEPSTPARFDVLASQSGSHPIVIRLATSAARATPIGTLKVTSSKAPEPGEPGQTGR